MTCCRSLKRMYVGALLAALSIVGHELVYADRPSAISSSFSNAVITSVGGGNLALGAHPARDHAVAVEQTPRFAVTQDSSIATLREAPTRVRATTLDSSPYGPGRVTSAQPPINAASPTIATLLNTLLQFSQLRQQRIANSGHKLDCHIRLLDSYSYLPSREVL